ADPTAFTRHLVGEATTRGAQLVEGTDARDLDRDVLVVACGAASPELVDVPIRPLVRQLVDTGPIPNVPGDLPMMIEAETSFHFRRVGEGLRLAMVEPNPRWGSEEVVDEALVLDWLERLAHRYPPAAGIGVARAWAGLYDMTPDAHPIIGWVEDGVYAACGFSGHGFMQSPAVGAAVAEELTTGGSSFDLSSYRLERFADGAVLPETLVLLPARAGTVPGRGYDGPVSNASPRRESSSMSKRPSIVASTSNSSPMSGSLPMSSRALLGTTCLAASSDSQR